MNTGCVISGLKSGINAPMSQMDTMNIHAIDDG